MFETLFLVVLAFVVLYVVGWLLGGAATVAGNTWRALDPEHTAWREMIRQYRAQHPDEPIYRAWEDDD